MAKHVGFSIRTIILITAAIWLCQAMPCGAAEDSIPPGTTITMQNWQQYKQFMPGGMQALFSGNYVWKMPADVRIEVGPTSHHPLPQPYIQNTEKYSHLVKIRQLPSGGHTVDGYVAGMPFPNPAEPLKGYKILVNFWYRYIPYLYCSPYDHEYLVNGAQQVSTIRYEDVYRRLSHISDVGQPINDPRLKGIDHSHFLMTLEPEQDRYTSVLILYYADPTQPDGEFIFAPKLRRVLRGSSSSRCAPVSGTDFAPDDFSAFSGGITRFQADLLREQRILALADSAPQLYGKPSNFYFPLFFPKPEIGKWEVRDAYVLDVRRVPSDRTGYCYGKQILYIDKDVYVIWWKDGYDTDLKLYKVEMADRIARPVPNEGIQYNGGNAIETMWDMDKHHLTAFVTATPEGKGVLSNDACRNVDGVNYDDVQRYSTPGGLSQVMR
jgi:Protein of unknown function (DUF1329)